MTERPLYEIAPEIHRDWKNVHYAAQPYLDAMSDLAGVSDYYLYDSGVSIVLYFLSNASSWRGETAKRIKAELKAMTVEPNKKAKAEHAAVFNNFLNR